ncbi:hypothetical protein CR513_36456, partial [Mucuna pruriens]
MEEEEIIEVEVKEIIEDEDVAILIKEETTISYHIIKEVVEITLVLSIEEEDMFEHEGVEWRFELRVNVSQYQNISENFDNPQSLVLASNRFLEDETIWCLDTGLTIMYGKDELFCTLDEIVKSIIKFKNDTNILIL